MEYKGKLYGHLGGKMYFDAGKTADDWDALEKRVAELEAENQALRQPDVIKSVSFDDFKTWGKCFEAFITRNAIHRKWDTFIEEWELEHGKLPPDYTYYEKNEE